MHLLTLGFESAWRSVWGKKIKKIILVPGQGDKLWEQAGGRGHCCYMVCLVDVHTPNHSHGPHNSQPCINKNRSKPTTVLKGNYLQREQLRTSTTSLNHMPEKLQPPCPARSNEGTPHRTPSLPCSSASWDAISRSSLQGKIQRKATLQTGNSGPEDAISERFWF